MSFLAGAGPRAHREPWASRGRVFLSAQVAGSEPFVYDGVGSGVLFPSEAHHRSGPASAGTLKITFFFGTNQSSAALFLSRKMRGEW